MQLTVKPPPPTFFQSVKAHNFFFFPTGYIDFHIFVIAFIASETVKAGGIGDH